MDSNLVQSTEGPSPNFNIDVLMVDSLGGRITTRFGFDSTCDWDISLTLNIPLRFC